MFMAILNDTYSEVKVEVENRREEFQVSKTYNFNLHSSFVGSTSDVYRESTAFLWPGTKYSRPSLRNY